MAYLRTLLSLLFCALMPTWLSAQAVSPVDRSRDILKEWVQAKKLISEEASEWAEQRETLESILSLLQTEKAGLKSQIAEAQEGASEADAQRSGLVERREEQKALIAAVEARTIEFERRMLALEKRFPPPLRESETMQRLVLRIPTDPEKVTLSVPERLQTLIGILDQVDKFNLLVTTVRKVQPLPSGEEAEVTAIYFGLGGGYFVDAAGTYAGVLRPGPDGWEAREVDGIADSVLNAIAQIERTATASFVELPVSFEN
ncbi:MAG: DUF3450 family protein [Opitutales bacterium]